MSPLSLIVIIGIGTIAYLAAADVFKKHSGFQYPRILASLVVLIGCAGLLGASDGVIEHITLPFAALLLAICAVAGITWIGRHKSVLAAKDRARHKPTLHRNNDETASTPWKYPTPDK